ncbi:DMT family transporter [Glaciimonas sp. GG7]
MIGLILGLNFPATKFAVEKIGVWNFRMISSSVALIPLLIVCRKTFSKNIFENKCNIIIIFFLAIPNIFLVPMLNGFSLLISKSSTSLVLIYSMPCMVSILRMIHIKKIDLYSIAAGVLTSLSIYGIVYKQGFGIGEALILISAFVWAIGTFFTGIYKTDIPLVISTTLQFLVSFVLILIVYIFVDNSIGNFEMELSAILVSIYVGLFGSAFVFYLWFSLIKNKGSEFASYASLLSLVFGVIFSNIILGEEITLSFCFSIVLILVSILIICFKENKIHN